VSSEGWDWSGPDTIAITRTLSSGKKLLAGKVLVSDTPAGLKLRDSSGKALVYR